MHFAFYQSLPVNLKLRASLLNYPTDMDKNGKKMPNKSLNADPKHDGFSNKFSRLLNLTASHQIGR